MVALKPAENGRIMGSTIGVPTTNIADKLWLVFQALGDIAFAYPYSILLLEIQVSFKFQLDVAWEFEFPHVLAQI